MIDGEHDDVGAPAAAFTPARRGNHQGERIGPAGDGKRHFALTGEGGEKSVEFGVA